MMGCRQRVTIASRISARRKWPTKSNKATTNQQVLFLILVIIFYFTSKLVSSAFVGKSAPTLTKTVSSQQQVAHDNEPMVINVSSLIVTNSKNSENFNETMAKMTTNFNNSNNQTNDYHLSHFNQQHSNDELHFGAKISLSVLVATIALVAIATIVDSYQLNESQEGEEEEEKESCNLREKSNCWRKSSQSKKSPSSMRNYRSLSLSSNCSSNICCSMSSVASSSVPILQKYSQTNNKNTAKLTNLVDADEISAAVASARVAHKKQESEKRSNCKRKQSSIEIGPVEIKQQQQQQCCCCSCTGSGNTWLAHQRASSTAAKETVAQRPETATAAAIERQDHERCCRCRRLAHACSGAASAAVSASACSLASGGSSANTNAAAAISKQKRNNSIGLEILLAFSLRQSSLKIFDTTASWQQQQQQQKQPVATPTMCRDQRPDSKQDNSATTTSRRQRLEATSGRRVSPSGKQLPIGQTIESGHERNCNESIDSLHGLRFLSMIWVIVIHSYNFALRWMYFTNSQTLEGIYKSLASQLLANGSFACDSFFFVGGFLLPYLAFKGPPPQPSLEQQQQQLSKTRDTWKQQQQQTTAAAAANESQETCWSSSSSSLSSSSSCSENDNDDYHYQNYYEEETSVKEGQNEWQQQRQSFCCAVEATKRRQRQRLQLSKVAALVALVGPHQQQKQASQAETQHTVAVHAHKNTNELSSLNCSTCCFLSNYCCSSCSCYCCSQPPLQSSDNIINLKQDELKKTTTTTPTQTRLLKNREGKNGITIKRVLANILHRYVRMMPLMMSIIGLSATLLRYLGDNQSIQWNESTMMFDQWCRKNWWVNAMFLHNFINRENMCLSHSWYSAVDLQLFLLGQVILFTLDKSRKIGLTLLVSLLFASQLLNALLTLWNHLPAVPLIASVSEQTMNLYYGQIYIKPYCRASPYLIGILLAYLMRTTSLGELKLKKWQVNIAWLCSVGSICGILFAMQPAMNGHQLSELQSTLYSTFSRPLWACSLAWIIFACITKQTNSFGIFTLIEKLLSAKCFIPMSRLTYPAFLIHPIVMAVFYGSRQNSFYFSHYLMLYLILGNIVITYACAFILATLFELPLISIEKLLSKRWFLTTTTTPNKASHLSSLSLSTTTMSTKLTC